MYLSNHELFVPKQQTAHLTEFRFCIMAGVFGDYSQFFRLFHVINFVGVRFVSILSFASVIKIFVWRENPERELQLKKEEIFGHQRRRGFLVRCRNSEFAGSVSGIKPRRHKTSFHDFSVNCGIPIAAILVSKQGNCRMCKKPLLLLDNEWKKTV